MDQVARCAHEFFQHPESYICTTYTCKDEGLSLTDRWIELNLHDSEMRTHTDCEDSELLLPVLKTQKKVGSLFAVGKKLAMVRTLIANIIIKLEILVDAKALMFLAEEDLDPAKVMAFLDSPECRHDQGSAQQENYYDRLRKYLNSFDKKNNQSVYYLRAQEQADTNNSRSVVEAYFRAVAAEIAAFRSEHGGALAAWTGRALPKPAASSMFPHGYCPLAKGEDRALPSNRREGVVSFDHEGVETLRQLAWEE